MRLIQAWCARAATSQPRRIQVSSCPAAPTQAIVMQLNLKVIRMPRLARLHAATLSRLGRPLRRLLIGFGMSDERATVMTEFAIVGPVFLFMLFFVFEIAYDQFLQEVLESSLAVTARQIQIGTSQSQTSGTNLTTPSSFMTQYFCPNTFGFLDCNSLFVRVEIISTAFPATCTDVSQATTGLLPVSNNVLNLGSFSGVSGAGTGTSLTPSACDTNSGQGYCSPSQNEFVLLTAIYAAPSFLGGFVPNTQLYRYNGNYVRAQLAATAFQTENFTAASGTKPSGYTGC